MTRRDGRQLQQRAPRVSRYSPQGDDSFSPSDIAGLQLWLDAQFTSDVTLNTAPDPDTVSAWADHSGNSNDIIQATAANQPEWEPTGWNSTEESVRNFITGDRFLYNDTTGISTLLNGDGVNWTAFMVVQLTSAPATLERYLMTWAHGTNSTPFEAIRYTSTGVVQCFTRNDASTLQTLASTITLDTNRHLLAVVRETSTIRFFLDGVASGTPAITNGTKSINRFALGGFRRNVQSGGSDSRFGAALVYGSALDSTNRRQVEEYLQARWGTPALP